MAILIIAVVAMAIASAFVVGFALGDSIGGWAADSEIRYGKYIHRKIRTWARKSAIHAQDCGAVIGCRYWSVNVPWLIHIEVCGCGVRFSLNLGFCTLASDDSGDIQISAKSVLRRARVIAKLGLRRWERKRRRTWDALHARVIRINADVLALKAGVGTVGLAGGMQIGGLGMAAVHPQISMGQGAAIAAYAGLTLMGVMCGAAALFAGALAILAPKRFWRDAGTIIASDARSLRGRIRVLLSDAIEAVGFYHADEVAMIRDSLRPMKLVFRHGLLLRRIERKEAAIARVKDLSDLQFKAFHFFDDLGMADAANSCFWHSATLYSGALNSGRRLWDMRYEIDDIVVELTEKERASSRISSLLAENEELTLRNDWLNEENTRLNAHFAEFKRILDGTTPEWLPPPIEPREKVRERD